MSEKTRLTVTAVICLAVVVVLVAFAVAFPFARAGAASDEPRWSCGTQLPTATEPAIPLEVYVWHEPAERPISRGWTHTGYHSPAGFAHVACEADRYSYFDPYEPRWHYLTFFNDTPVTCAHAPSSVGDCRRLNPQDADHG